MQVFKGRIITPTSSGGIFDENAYLVVENGKIKRISREKPVGDYIDFSDKIILPGFVDTHIHLPQIGIRGRWSNNLLDWLEKYVFPEEIKFIDEDYTEKMAHLFFKELIRNGTVAAMIYGPPNRESTIRALEVAKRYGLRVFLGQTLMDMNVPEELITPVERAVEDVKTVANKAEGRVEYVLTLRFAPSCSMELMKRTSEIARNLGLRIQTHISEQRGEIELVEKIFGTSYANVYDIAGVLYPRTVLAHGIYLSEEELSLISSQGSKIAHCPSSNFFLHSGVMNIVRVERSRIEVGLGSDVAGGPFINMLPVGRDAYYANHMAPSKILYLLTLGGAKVLGIEKELGSIEQGKEASFIVARCPENCQDKSTEEVLADLIFLGDDRSIEGTYIMGKDGSNFNL